MVACDRCVRSASWRTTSPIGPQSTINLTLDRLTRSGARCSSRRCRAWSSIVNAGARRRPGRRRAARDGGQAPRAGEAGPRIQYPDRSLSVRALIRARVVSERLAARWDRAAARRPAPRSPKRRRPWGDQVNTRAAELGYLNSRARLLTRGRIVFDRQRAGAPISRPRSVAGAPR